MRNTLFLLLTFITVTPCLKAQEAEIDRLLQNELKYTFPSIYFKHNSTNYAPMPYRTDSCYKFIAINYNKTINSLVIWRDSAETEGLTIKRIQKIKGELKKYLKPADIEIVSMGDEQKISRRTIGMTTDKTKIDKLLSLNSVFDISKTRVLPKTDKKKKSRRRLVWTGWKTGFHWSTAG